MSQYVNEIVLSIKNDPEAWTPARDHYRLDGIKNNSISVTGFGNTKPFSIIHVLVDGLEVETTYVDRWRLEGAVVNWYKTQNLESILKK